MRRLLTTLCLLPSLALANGRAAAKPTAAKQAPAPAPSDGAKPGQAPEPGHPPFVIDEARVNPRRHLDVQLAKLARKAAAEHKRVLVYFGAPWCVACELIKPTFWREENRALFRHWELVQVDVDALPEGPVLGIPFDTIPFLMKLDRSGHVSGTLRGNEVLRGGGTNAQVDAAFARFLGT